MMTSLIGLLYASIVEVTTVGATKEDVYSDVSHRFQ